MVKVRTGIGYDVHKLVRGRKLILGGVNISHTKGLLGHSDADVLFHAICDALLGAAGLGDIGEHFSDKDTRFKNADSAKFLQTTQKLIHKKGFAISNIDAVVIAEAPKLSPYKEQMKKNISKHLRIKIDQVNVKATTEEGMGFTGTKKGMAAWAVATIVARGKR